MRPLRGPNTAEPHSRACCTAARRYQKIAERRKAAALARDQQQQQQPGSQDGAAAEVADGLPPLAGDAYSRLLAFEAVPSTQNCSLQVGGMWARWPGIHQRACLTPRAMLTPSPHPATPALPHRLAAWRTA